ncbi:unnamed protein product [Musa acuminata subsp. malaccensis]|uniref:(wild Malaysian banana) hypothetical protein n=1 Tax=Musa acuminata subsp. malaccensis TaxID=214687 RepID=A0A804J525_MUSAM|nr:PREDICTED: protein BIG GRAIN 1-like [Musa acuminata subsp. malaccensis]CAG1838818.1 unnamed protein product [Musa acuminata subsp. malaccensis]
MERWGKERQRRGHECPSFSSTLLDAIYRSMDESDAGGAPEPSLAASRRPAMVVSERAGSRPRGLPPISTSSSSDNSSYGGFSSSSEPESASSHRARLRPIRSGEAPARCTAVSSPPTRPPPPPPLQQHQRISSPPVVHHRERTKSSSIRSKLWDLGRSKAPASPGGRLAALLNSLFASAAKRPKKSKTPTATAAGAVGGYDDSACSTLSSHSRSCLVKAPSSRRAPPAEDEGAKRSVRFHPMSVIVGEDLRPCGQKNVYAGDRAAEGRRRTVATEVEGKGKTKTRMRVEELLRRFEDGEEEDGEISDSSSDLFELENLTVMTGGEGYRDELPMYETTHAATNRAISRGLVP